MNNSKNKNRTITVYAVLAGALVISAVLSLALGSSRLTPQQVIGGIAGVQSPQVNVIIRSIRIPRLAAALVSGVGLSVAGVLLQAVTDNDLA
ncbi:MAG: iron chelate uptake ABC transporter family permease subunit, partial [Oscillospiraceae bacterium]|nr:iron chelate uptake ABC transporter family permease subunit [Oscillospiraceae bacterium]